MLVSSKVLEKALTQLPNNVSVALEQFKLWFTNLVNTQGPDARPDIRIIEEEKVVVMYCSEELWLIVNRWKMKDLKSMNFLDFVKLWKEIKPIMEKE